MNLLRTSCTTLAGIMVSTLLLPSAHAGNAKTSQSNGKPFQEIHQRIDENRSFIEQNAADIAAVQAVSEELRDLIAANADAIASLGLDVQSNAQAIANLADEIAQNSRSIRINRAELRRAVASLNAHIRSIRVDIRSLRIEQRRTLAQISRLSQDLNAQTRALRVAVDDNALAIDGLIIDVTSLNSDVTQLNTDFLAQSLEIQANSDALDDQQDQIDGILEEIALLDANVSELQSLAHSHQAPASCHEILESNPSASSGIYSIDVDGEGDGEAFDAYCDMENFGGGWTNLNFSSNQVLLENGHFINCSSLTQTANSIRCDQPILSNGGYLYHFFCSGTDNSADYMLEHIGAVIGHQSSETTGFSSLTQSYTGAHGESTPNMDEYLYIDGEILLWSDPAAHIYSQNRNGNCVPSFFTLTL